MDNKRDLLTSTVSPNSRINLDRIRILNVDMPQVIQEQIISVAQQAISKDHSSSDTAGYIKKECDRLFGPIWHVVVGKSFGSFVTHGIYHSLPFPLIPL